MSHSSFNSSSRSEHERLASGDPSNSLSPPSAEPSDHSSRGRPPIRVSEESVGQHYFVVLDSDSPSLSRNGAPVSGGAIDAFTCRGVRTVLSVNDLARISRKYDLFGALSIFIPLNSSDASVQSLGFGTLYKDALAVSLRLPLHPLARNLLNYLGIAPGQLSPNGWRFLMGAAYL